MLLPASLAGSYPQPGCLIPGCGRHQAQASGPGGRRRVPPRPRAAVEADQDRRSGAFTTGRRDIPSCLPELAECCRDQVSIEKAQPNLDCPGLSSPAGKTIILGMQYLPRWHGLRLTAAGLRLFRQPGLAA
jgi:hypothetical protein